MANDVTILIKAIDNASATIKKVEGATGGMQAAFKGLGIAAASAGAVIGAGVAVWKKAVEPIINYNKAILDAARSTRMSTEELSRFVQVGDDMGVGIDSITRALQMATKNGFAPSISAIADLADKANAMNTPTERAAALAKMFGRNWAELDPILQLGGERIRDLAAAQKDGLVATEAEIKKTEELRLAIDEWKDEVEGILNEIGLSIGGVIVEGGAQADEFSDRWSTALAVVRSRGIEPTKQNIDRMFQALESGAVLEHIFAIRDALESIKPPNIIPPGLEGYGSKYLPIGSGGGAGGYAGYVGQTPTARPTEEFTGGNTPNDNAWRAYWDMMAGGSSQAAETAKNIVDYLDSIRDKTVTVTILEETVKQEGHTYLEHGAASGADFVVPPGYPNDSYRMGVESGERVQVTPPGEASRSGANVTINVSSTPMDVQWITKQLKSAVGM